MRSWIGFLVAAAAALSGCSQFTTNDSERSALEATAGKAGDAYVSCVIAASKRYQQTGEPTSVIVEVSKKACTSERAAFAAADAAYLKSRYMQTQPIVDRHLAELDARATNEIESRVLEGRAAAPAAAAATAAAVAPAAGGGSNAYLDCMRAQGQRYASVNEPAEVVAEVAHSRCASSLTDPASAAQLERQGRALVMGMVLDRKVVQ